MTVNYKKAITDKRYRQSTKGKAMLARYAQTDKCKANQRKFRLSPRGQSLLAKYEKTTIAKTIHKSYQQTLRGKFRRSVTGAKQRGLEFKLTLEQFSSWWQKPCHYCGESIGTIGLDRVDNLQGYTTDNVVPCCRPCNVAKMTQTVGEFVARCHRVAQRHALSHPTPVATPNPAHQPEPESAAPHLPTDSGTGS